MFAIKEGCDADRLLACLREDPSDRFIGLQSDGDGYAYAALSLRALKVRSVDEYVSAIFEPDGRLAVFADRIPCTRRLFLNATFLAEERLLCAAGCEDYFVLPEHPEADNRTADEAATSTVPPEFLACVRAAMLGR